MASNFPRMCEGTPRLFHDNDASAVTAVEIVVVDVVEFSILPFLPFKFVNSATIFRFRRPRSVLKEMKLSDADKRLEYNITTLIIKINIYV